MKLIAAGVTDVGLMRRDNQDSVYVNKELRLLAVADGMGGHAGGKCASEMCIECIKNSIQEDCAKQAIKARDSIRKAISIANTKIFQKGSTDPNLKGMGTTVSMLYFTDDRAFIGHVGDSRSYLIHDGLIWQLTQDHNVVEEKLRARLITRQQAAQEKNRNIITRSVGFEKDIQIDIYEKEIFPQEYYLICSDGLSNMLSNQSILESVFQNPCSTQKELEEIVQDLLLRANNEGGEDNITIILAKLL